MLILLHELFDICIGGGGSIHGSYHYSVYHFSTSTPSSSFPLILLIILLVMFSFSNIPTPPPFLLGLGCHMNLYPGTLTNACSFLFNEDSTSIITSKFIPFNSLSISLFNSMVLPFSPRQINCMIAMPFDVMVLACSNCNFKYKQWSALGLPNDSKSSCPNRSCSWSSCNILLNTHILE